MEPQIVTKKRQYDQINLKLAYDATLKGMSVYRASRQFGVPESTLRDRTRGYVPLSGSNPGPERLFSRDEEANLVSHVQYMANVGYGYTKTSIQHLGSEYAVSLSKRSSAEQPLSDRWFYGFLHRWPDIHLAKPQKLPMQREKCASRETLDKYFKELSSILKKNSLIDKPENIYNIDEYRLSTEHNPSRIICEKNSVAQAYTLPRSSQVTIIGGGNAVGYHIPPYFVFPGKRWNNLLIEGAPFGSDGEMTESGWSNSSIFQKYLTEHFTQHVKINTTGKNSPKTLILYDGHKSYLSLTLLDWANKNNVILFVLPPRTSCLIQPLDVGVFGPMKSVYYRECQHFLQINPGQKITKYEVGKLAGKAYQMVMSPENLKSAFSKAGVYPINNSVICNCQVAPSTIYQDDCMKNIEGETHVEAGNAQQSIKNHTDVVNCSGDAKAANSFKARKITRVIKKPVRKFVPPFITGNLVKQSNTCIIKLKQTAANKTASQRRTLPKPKAKTSLNVPNETLEKVSVNNEIKSVQNSDPKTSTLCLNKKGSRIPLEDFFDSDMDVDSEDEV